MKTIIFTPGNENQTPKVVKALSEMKDGGILKFREGEYHFYTEGCVEKFFAPTNNANGVKKIIFPIIGMKNVTVDGGGATFVFHGAAFPFIVSDSENIEIKNFTETMDHLPYALMQMGQKRDDGFFLKMHPETYHSVDENGQISLLGKEGNTILSTKNSGCFSLHSLDRIRINYLFAGDYNVDPKGLAAPYYDTVASEVEEGLIFCKYLENEKAIKCSFDEGENIGVLTEGRTKDVFFLADSSEVRIADVTIRRGTGMGIVAQCCHNVSVDGFKAIPTNGEPATLTADALHFVHCSGTLDIRNCEVRKSMDDFLNVHGMYVTVSEVLKDGIKVKIGHREQSLFLPFRGNDKLQVIDRETLNIKGELTFDSYEFTDEKGMEANVRVGDPENLSFVSVGDLIDDADRMPEQLNFVGNKGYDIPRILMQGGKHYYHANNELRGFVCAMKCEDVPNYWYESGRVGEVIMENNIIDGMGKLRGPAVIVGVTGFEYGKAPKVHGKIVIRNNKFIGIGDNLIKADGVKELILENNELI